MTPSYKYCYIDLLFPQSEVLPDGLMRILGTSWSDCDSSAAALNGYWWEATLGNEPTKGSTKCCCELDGWWHMNVLK